jgi:hypothetical protein
LNWVINKQDEMGGGNGFFWLRIGKLAGSFKNGNYIQGSKNCWEFFTGRAVISVTRSTTFPEDSYLYILLMTMSRNIYFVRWAYSYSATEESSK